MIADRLKVGKENATSTAELCAVLGFENARDLRNAIAKERKAGAVILSSCTGGYFLPGSKAEVEEFIHTQDKKARSIMFVLKSARQYMNTIEGQLAIPDGKGE